MQAVTAIVEINKRGGGVGGAVIIFSRSFSSAKARSDGNLRRPAAGVLSQGVPGAIQVSRALHVGAQESLAPSLRLESVQAHRA